MQHRFEVALERPDEPGTTAFFRVPPEVMRKLGPRKRVPVRVTINGFTWRSTIAVYGGECYVGVRAEVRASADVTVGDRMRVTLELDDAPRTVEIPPDLKKALRAARLHAAFDVFSFSHQNEYVRWIIDAKRPETRATRIAKTIDETREKSLKP